MLSTFGSSEPWVSRFLGVYAILTTLFCFYFIHLTKFNFKACLPSPEVPVDLATTDLIQNTTFINATEVDTEPEEPKPSYPAEFPRRIWQTTKTGASGLGDNEREQIQSWIQMNQNHRYEAMTKYSSETFAKERIADKPDILNTFVAIEDKMMRADMTKYLVLYGDGGLYCDLDTVSLKPIDAWIPAEYKKKANLVVGVEYDVLDGGRWGDWTLDLQFASWSILAKPRHLALELALNSGVKRLNDLAKQQGTTVSKMKASYKEVLDSTGPALFSRAVFEAIRIQIEDPNFTWKNISGMTEPRLYGDVLILPITAFGSDQAHSNSGSSDDPTALVKHLFAGSWKADHPFREQMEKQEQEEKKDE